MRWSLATRISLALVLVDIAFLAAMGLLATFTDFNGRAIVELWGKLHWPTSAIAEHLIGPRSIHDPRLTPLLSGLLIACLAQAAAVGWMIGRLLQLFKRHGS
jgi:hypothetical protein